MSSHPRTHLGWRLPLVRRIQQCLDVNGENFLNICLISACVTNTSFCVHQISTSNKLGNENFVYVKVCINFWDTLYSFLWPRNIFLDSFPVKVNIWPFMLLQAQLIVTDRVRLLRQLLPILHWNMHNPLLFYPSEMWWIFKDLTALNTKHDGSWHVASCDPVHTFHCFGLPWIQRQQCPLKLSHLYTILLSLRD